MDLDPSVVWDFAGTLVGTLRERPRQLPATVSRVDPDGTVWLSMPGADGLVPASTIADVGADDAVTVEWWGNAYHVTGNRTSPSVGTRAAAALRRATAAAAKVAGEAKGIADAVGQHFWSDDNGVHVSNEDGNATGERNILMNSLGILLRQGSAWLASFSDSAVAFYDGLGNAASNIVAQFGADGAQIGRAGESHAEIDSNSLQFVDESGETFFLVNDAVEASEATSLVEIFESTGSSTDNTLTLQHTPTRTPLIYRTDGMPSTITSVSGNVLTLAFALYPGSIAIVPYETTDYHAMNGKTMMLGVNENVLLAAGAYSASVGTDNQPSGDRSMTVGNGCRTVDPEALASGVGCLAAGEASVAHGLSAKAVGFSSFAQGGNVIAYGPYQHAIGRFNEVDIGDNYAFVIGNGTSNSARSNAFAVGWDGTLYTARDTDTTTVADVLTAAQGVTIGAVSYIQRGGVAALFIRASRSAATSGATTIGTLVTGKRPVMETAAPAPSGSGDVFVAPDGTVTYRPSGTVAAGSNLYVRITYLVA